MSNEVTNNTIDESVNESPVNDEIVNDEYINEQVELPKDPVIEFLSSLKFSSNVLNEIENCHYNPDSFAKYYNVSPDFFILTNAVNVIRCHDPNRGGLGEKESIAFENLLRWFIIKYALEPQWRSYIGWLIRFFATHMHPSSYYPIKYGDRFLPNYFYKKGEVLVDEIERKKIRDVGEAFKWVPENK